MLEAREEWPPRRDAAQERERVVRDADERRREHRQQRRVVVAVLEQPEVHEQVDDLLLAEVALAGRAVRRQPRPPQLVLVPLRVGAGGEEEDDLARSRGAGVHELADAPRHRARLAAPPVDAAVLVALLVGDEQLDGVAEDRVRELGRSRELLELAAEMRAEELVDGGEHLGARAVVERQRERLLDGLAPLAEDLHVGVAEAVDRLELVADEEELGLPASAAGRRSRVCRRFVSWNSSTRIERKRACSRSRSSGCDLRRSRASSWRSSKSSADSRAFAWAYRSANSVRSSCSSARSRAAASSSAACSTAASASQ